MRASLFSIFMALCCTLLSTAMYLRESLVLERKEEKRIQYPTWGLTSSGQRVTYLDMFMTLPLMQPRNLLIFFAAKTHSHLIFSCLMYCLDPYCKAALQQVGDQNEFLHRDIPPQVQDLALLWVELNETVHQPLPPVLCHHQIY